MSAAKTANFLKLRTKLTRRSLLESAALVVKRPRWIPFTKPESSSTRTSLPTMRLILNSVLLEDQAQVPLREIWKTLPNKLQLQKARKERKISVSKHRLLRNKKQLKKKRKSDLNVLLTLMPKSLPLMPSACLSLTPISVSYCSRFSCILLMIYYFLSLPLTLWDEI